MQNFKPASITDAYKGLGIPSLKLGTLDNIITNVKEGAGFVTDRIVESYWSGMKGRNPISYNNLRSKSM